MAEGCLFCRIVAGEIPADIVFRGAGVVGFRDIAPKAPVHILIVPEVHISGAAEVTADTEEIAGRLIRIAAAIARQQNIGESGYRLIINQGEDAGQSVAHLHIHLLGGAPLSLNLA